MAYDFNGTNQYLDLASVPVSGVPLTMAGWYRYDTALGVGQEMTIMSLTDASDDQEFTIEIGENGGTDYAIAVTFSGGFNGALSSVEPQVNTWEHIGGVFSAIDSRIVYLNGVNVGSDSGSATPSGISNVNIGATLSSGAPAKDFNGAIAECAIWNVALTATEMAILADGFSPLFVRPQSLVFYAPIVRGLQNLKGGTSLTNNSGTVFSHPRIYYPTGYTIAPFAAAATNTRRYSLTTLGVG